MGVDVESAATSQTAVPAEQTLFVRKASGLVKGWSSTDGFRYAFISTNFAVGRLFPLPREGATLGFKAEAYNVFNTPNLANPASVLSNSTSNSTINTFGVVLATVGTNGNVGTNGRRMQLSLVLRY